MLKFWKDSENPEKTLKIIKMWQSQKDNENY